MYRVPMARSAPFDSASTNAGMVVGSWERSASISIIAS
jgi:hypothetical protein